jgi:hypothetical protein
LACRRASRLLAPEPALEPVLTWVSPSLNRVWLTCGLGKGANPSSLYAVGVGGPEEAYDDDVLVPKLLAEEVSENLTLGGGRRKEGFFLGSLVLEVVVEVVDGVSETAEWVDETELERSRCLPLTNGERKPAPIAGSVGESSGSSGSTARRGGGVKVDEPDAGGEMGGDEPGG